MRTRYMVLIYMENCRRILNIPLNFVEFGIDLSLVPGVVVRGDTFEPRARVTEHPGPHVSKDQVRSTGRRTPRTS
jgi:hypothetical protein